MTTACPTCGREQERGIYTHWLGCKAIRLPEVADAPPEPDPGPPCEHPGCTEPRKPWTGRGARPKYCATGHK